MYNMGFIEDDFAFEDLTQDRLCALAARYDLDYAVVFNAWGIDGETEYDNDTFAVFPVQNLTCQDVASEPSGS